MNNIVRIMLRKGILTDLARVSHYLDLSSPNMPASVNAALKPLETLSRIVNQPTAATNNKAGKQKAQGSVSEEQAGDQTGPVYNFLHRFSDISVLWLYSSCPVQRWFWLVYNVSFFFSLLHLNGVFIQIPYMSE